MTALIVALDTEVRLLAVGVVGSVGAHVIN